MEPLSAPASSFLTEADPYTDRILRSYTLGGSLAAKLTIFLFAFYLAKALFVAAFLYHIVFLPGSLPKEQRTSCSVLDLLCPLNAPRLSLASYLPHWFSSSHSSLSFIKWTENAAGGSFGGLITLSW
ncbi:hypothetical protein HYDPIDRAFT_116385 [Hydnomerulius pinastri MD-312]|uniref:Uncharacterized protein n=1 Tax=Hydnomerulius pinastri MD-312 TaxID=994086 RepID=A0A0C9W449_9AGAM|nr:hypothetical protein HYDPIDRAFT_116385 [Hydnomerulius pinastri MD-312]